MIRAQGLPPGHRQAYCGYCNWNGTIGDSGHAKSEERKHQRTEFHAKHRFLAKPDECGCPPNSCRFTTVVQEKAP